MFIQVLPWPQGELSAVWSEQGLYRLVFGRLEGEPGDAAQVVQSLRSGQIALARAMADYFAGGELEFPLAHLDWTGTPEFHRRVLQRCVQIARGETWTYGQLANAVGSPGAARAVGQAMARNRWPLIIPCHRVLGHSGKLTGYSGQGGTATKRWLLDREQCGTAALLL